MAVIITLFIWPLLVGAILLSVGVYAEERLLRACGEAFLGFACFLMVFQFFMVRDHNTWVEYGVFLGSWADYLGFAGAILAAGLLIGDGIFQALPKKSSSS